MKETPLQTIRKEQTRIINEYTPKLNQCLGTLIPLLTITPEHGPSIKTAMKKTKKQIKEFYEILDRAQILAELTELNIQNDGKRKQKLQISNADTDDTPKQTQPQKI